MSSSSHICHDVLITRLSDGREGAHGYAMGFDKPSTPELRPRTPSR